MRYDLSMSRRGKITWESALKQGSSLARTRRSLGRNRKVVTTAPMGLRKNSRGKEPCGHYVNQEDVRDPREASVYREACRPGAMWFVKKDLVMVERGSDPSREGTRHLRANDGFFPKNEIVVRKGTMCIYAGSEEEKARRKNCIVTSVKHTFIIGTGRWIIVKLSLLKPAELALNAPPLPQARR